MINLPPENLAVLPLASTAHRAPFSSLLMTGGFERSVGSCKARSFPARLLTTLMEPSALFVMLHCWPGSVATSKKTGLIRSSWRRPSCLP